MGRIKPKTVALLMYIANRFVDREDACHNKRMRSSEDDRANRYNNLRQRSCNYNNYGSHSQVAAGYKEKITKEKTTETQGTVMRTDKIRVAMGSLGQGVQENTTSHQTISSTGHATCTTRTSTERESIKACNDRL
jgi:hypothetical protein